MSLSVLVKSASGLPNVDTTGKSDPMCVIVLEGEKKKTDVIKDDLDPQWNETLTWTLQTPLSGSEFLNVEVYDYEKFRTNRLLGALSLPLQEVVSRGSQGINSALMSREGDVMESKIVLELKYKAPEGSRGGVGDRERGGDKEAAGKVDGGEEAHRRAHTRDKLLNKPMDWQVRVHVLEARKLVGGQLSPMVKVVCGRISRKTSSRKGTNNPFFDEILFFSFIERPQEVFDRVVEVKVLNSGIQLFRNKLIGSFKFDLGMVYDEPDNCFIHKWLLLTDPDDPSCTAKGYLKISINVIGPGHDPKLSPSSLSQELVDIESNLLRPSGARLQSGTLIIKIYRGEDMPQMDPGYIEKVKKIFHFGAIQKELVDPYCMVSFAGKNGETPVIWNEQDPVWNYQINLGIRFPSMCDRIRLRLNDKDKPGNDDVIGTTFISMSQISPDGDDKFLTFGPCFVNLYGSPREFTHFPDKYDYLNMGMIEGVAYRGRVMVEIDVVLGELPVLKGEPINKSDKESVQPFLRRHSYKLYGAFFSGTMIHPIDKPIEFEVSIGNYGNKLEVNIPAQSSTTPPSNPVFDGRHYHYLPWLEQKPCVVVNSQWEDCTYRITSMNIILNMANKLEMGLEAVKKEMATENDDIDAIKTRMGAILHDFICDASQGLPQLPEKSVNKLDRLRHGLRIEKLKTLEDSSIKLAASIELLQNPTEMDSVVNECQNYLSVLRDLAIEPQQSVPDVMVWMLAGTKRVACTRIPAHKLFHADGKGRGQQCGKVQTVFLTPPAVEDEDDLKKQKDEAQIRVMLWLEMDKEGEGNKSHFHDKVKLIGGEFSIYAETYENQVLVGKWGTDGLTRPNWSDSSGKIEQPKETFDLPPGWSWDGEWFPQPELSTIFDMDENRDEWTEEIYENQARLPLSSWSNEIKSCWTNVMGDVIKGHDGKEIKTGEQLKQLQCPEGWLWKSDWQVDMDRAVDNRGWEYAIEAGISNWVPYDRNGYLFRRRRLVRIRERDKNAKPVQKKQWREAAQKEGWEYAQLAHLTYHITKQPLDFARRRRYLRKLTGDPHHPPIFHFKSKERKIFFLHQKKEDGHQQVPRIFVTFKEAHTYQLRAYIYQARDMYGSDRSGLSDPYCLVSFHTSSAKTIVISETVCPTWDQTILIKNIRIFGDTSKVVESPPPVVIEFMDKDTVGCHEFIGRTEACPVVRLSLDTPGPRLDWFPIVRYNKRAGEILAAFELLLDEGNELPFTPPTASPPYTHYIVPSGIRPILENNRIEILCWGVRDMKRFQLLQVTSPLVEFECGGETVRSEPIKDANNNSNFTNPVLSFEVLLPKENLYAPPLNICVMDKRSFCRCPLVGLHVVKSLKKYRVDHPKSSSECHALAFAKVTTPTSSSINEGEVNIIVEDTEDALNFDPDSQKVIEFDWWSKYYYSIGDQQRTQQAYVDRGYDKMEIYPHHLEDSFNNFEDLVQTFPLYRGKGSRDLDEPDGKCIGFFKGSLKVYTLPYPPPDTSTPSLFPNNISTKPVQCVIRVYVIRAENLMAKDLDGKSDPYIKVKVGKGGKGKEISDKDCYIPSNLNPIFGKMFELNADLPLDHTLTVKVMDWDRHSAHDLIGETKIDLENRFISHRRATCGLPKTFHKQGVNKWHDHELPVQILEDWCKMMKINPPEWYNKSKVVVDNELFTLDQLEKSQPLPKENLEGRYQQNQPLPEEELEDRDQQLALNVIKQKCNFVPEHVEKRTLYNPSNPDISMGALHMWVDIFPKQGSLPPPVDISPRKPAKFVLRVVVYNTKDVLLDEISVVAGEAMSDIYVKGWIRGQDETQQTDVHYRSRDGEGNFNWRLVFPFQYLPAEQVMVIQKKQHFYSLTKTEVHVPPRFTLQVWDDDILNPDDLIGTIDFNLTGIPKPVKDAINCSMDQLPPEVEIGNESGKPMKQCRGSSDLELINLFHKKRIKGWWPVFFSEEGERELTGKLELEMEIVTEEEAVQRPAAKARDEPNQNPHLEKPNRPATSFLWFTSPLKTFKHIIWKHYKWHIVWSVAIILLVIFLVIVIYTAPSAFMKWVTSRLLPV